MAHASVDCHLDFISLLSLANIGVIEPEVSLSKKQVASNDHSRSISQQGDPKKETKSFSSPSSLLKGTVLLNGESSLNGIYRGLAKRRRDQRDSIVEVAALEGLEAAEDEQFDVKVFSFTIVTYTLCNSKHS